MVVIALRSDQVRRIFKGDLFAWPEMGNKLDIEI